MILHLIAIIFQTKQNRRSPKKIFVLTEQCDSLLEHDLQGNKGSADKKDLFLHLHRAPCSKASVSGKTLKIYSNLFCIPFLYYY
jgi:hypothetical protein